MRQFEGISTQTIAPLIVPRKYCALIVPRKYCALIALARLRVQKEYKNLILGCFFANDIFVLKLAIELGERGEGRRGKGFLLAIELGIGFNICSSKHEFPFRSVANSKNGMSLINYICRTPKKTPCTSTHKAIESYKVALVRYGRELCLGKCPSYRNFLR